MQLFKCKRSSLATRKPFRTEPLTAEMEIGKYEAKKCELLSSIKFFMGVMRMENSVVIEPLLIEC
jgi:hypothetical protein